MKNKICSFKSVPIEKSIIDSFQVLGLQIYERSRIDKKELVIYEDNLLEGLPYSLVCIVEFPIEEDKFQIIESDIWSAYAVKMI